MTDTQTELAALLPELYDEERRATEAPTTEEILSYLTGELSPAAEEAFQERLSFHPEATQLLLDLADPSRLVGRDDADLPLPDPDALRRRLRDEGVFERLAPVVPIRPRGVRFYRWAAAALLVLSVGLGIQLVRQGDEGPAADVAIWELLPLDESGPRDAGDVVNAVPGFSHDLVLYAYELSPDAGYRIVVVDENGGEILSRQARTNAPGRVILRLGESDLDPGRYEIRLFAGGEPSAPIAVYALDWRLP